MNPLLTNLVLNEGGCFRCALRFSGELSLNNYLSVTSDYTSFLTKTQHPCTICLGILNPNSYLNYTHNTILASNYEFNDYKFQVILPPIVYLRNEYILGKCKLSGINPVKVIEIKDVFKWMFSPSLGVLLNKKFNVDSDFRVNIDFGCSDSEEEVKRFYNEFGCRVKESLQTVFKSVNHERLVACFPIVKNFLPEIKVSCSYAPVYVAGNYMKYSRKVSQTPWSVEGSSEVIDSVQDCLSRPLVEAFKSSGCTLHSSGREDIDVRMLGRGRPFILEIAESKSALSGFNKINDLHNIINSSNEYVKVSPLKKVGKDYFDEIRKGEEGKLKVYSCIVWSEKSISQSDMDYITSLPALELQQKTPIRVMHRRSLKTRQKFILKMQAYYINPHFFQLRLVSSAGTYIKEFVHSDFGRTTPSINKLLGCKTDILQLDVLGLGWDLEEVKDLLTSEIE
ncbi:hypothetical protein SteCoe_14557 [Stentor coeruleus]|uniref:tRNA pseudouridine(55) synthase n=1 Tax=Stentor coeruleus TaxID=5963 RepID=A0A1R2C5P3_9CILI|nr:hypothetical protein SteCoe_14557 [Stentor coeruleus]